MHAFLERFSARCFDSIQPIRQNRAENIHHLPIAIGCSPQLALDPPHGRWQLPLLEGGTIPQGTGLPCEHGDVVQRVVDIFAASEDARMLTHELSILPELDAFSISADLDGTADGMSLDRVAVVVEPDEAGLRDRGRHRMVSVEGASIGHKAWALSLEDVPGRSARAARGAGGTWPKLSSDLAAKHSVRQGF